MKPISLVLTVKKLTIKSQPFVVKCPIIDLTKNVPKLPHNSFFLICITLKTESLVKTETSFKSIFCYLSNIIPL